MLANDCELHDPGGIKAISEGLSRVKRDYPSVFNNGIHRVAVADIWTRTQSGTTTWCMAFL